MENDTLFFDGKCVFLVLFFGGGKNAIALHRMPYNMSSKTDLEKLMRKEFFLSSFDCRMSEL